MRARVLALLVASLVGAVAACVPTAGDPVASAPGGLPSRGPARTAGSVVTRPGPSSCGPRGAQPRPPGSQAPFRPPEDDTFTAAPRAVYQVILPAGPRGGLHRRLRVPGSDQRGRRGRRAGRVPRERPGPRPVGVRDAPRPSPRRPDGRPLLMGPRRGGGSRSRRRSSRRSRRSGSGCRSRPEAQSPGGDAAGAYR